MRAALAELDQGDFTEGHELDPKWRVPKEMIGRRLPQEEAKRLFREQALIWTAVAAVLSYPKND
jgi:hypothetical protein